MNIQQLSVALLLLMVSCRPTFAEVSAPSAVSHASRAALNASRTLFGTFSGLSVLFAAPCSRSVPLSAAASISADCENPLLSVGIWSERRDLNSGPPVPQTGALTGLRYAPPMRRRCTLARHRAQDQEADQEAAKSRRSGSGWPERGGARRCGNILARSRHQTPQKAGDKEIVAPVIDVDDGALGDGADISCIDRLIDGLPRAWARTGSACS
jgi:hypothetical protein